MSDSSFIDINPREVILDPAMQARDTDLIKNKSARRGQELKQESQSKEILDDLHNGVGIKQPITLFEVNGKKLVVDGFHRVGASLEYMKEAKRDDFTVRAMLIKNRSYTEAFLTAQEANQSHGVGVTKDEVNQSKFRSLVVAGKYDYSVSEIQKLVGCCRGQANHVSRALKTCCEVIQGKLEDYKSLESFTNKLQSQLKLNYPEALTKSAWDSKGFPKVRRLSDAVSGKKYIPKDKTSEEYRLYLIEDTYSKIDSLIESVGEDNFREALRKTARGSTLGISITRRDKWLEQAGTLASDEVPDNWDGSSVPESSYDAF
ncbi:hypothetical protein [Pseudoalteromonas sp. T1lg10]|uniref:hypothetical protein n=1 Tax=Pseudoalteromonas sp. T1lg10 TaxID=2077093 RepID=UPI001F3A56F2|nr:hypothetical protein [Pseudoalteromonas sp. T1lg10]